MNNVPFDILNLSAFPTWNIWDGILAEPIYVFSSPLIVILTLDVFSPADVENCKLVVKPKADVDVIFAEVEVL